MNMQNQLKEMPNQQYPFYPPNENELCYDPELTTLRSDPLSIDKQAKFCPVCDYPIVVRVVLMPCRHYMCYECYLIKGSTYCKICNECISQFHRLVDNAKFFSCDLESCGKYFENEAEYQNHMKMHDELNALKQQ